MLKLLFGPTVLDSHAVTSIRRRTIVRVHAGCDQIRTDYFCLSFVSHRLALGTHISAVRHLVGCNCRQMGAVRTSPTGAVMQAARRCAGRGCCEGAPPHAPLVHSRK
jgi:hypothetical protein